MELVTKNIILYDELGGVSGFAEFRIREDRTDIKIRHNFGVADVLRLSVMMNCETKIFKMKEGQSLFEVSGSIDTEKEIFVCLYNGEELLASGIINQGVRDSLVVPARNDEMVKELDEVFRKVCVIDENGKGQCESCPYREHFFGEVATDEIVV